MAWEESHEGTQTLNTVFRNIVLLHQPARLQISAWLWRGFSVHSTTTHTPIPLPSSSAALVQLRRNNIWTAGQHQTNLLQHHGSSSSNNSCLFPTIAQPRQPCVTLQNPFQVMKSLQQFTLPHSSMPATLPTPLCCHKSLKDWKV